MIRKRAMMARERKLGHVIVSTAIDKPWSQYYCRMPASAVHAVRLPQVH